MSAMIDAVSLTARLVNASLVLLAGVYVLYRYNRSKLQQSLYWGLGLVLFGIAFVFPFGFGIGLIGRTLPAYFVEQTFLTFVMVLFYYASATTLTKSRFYSTFLAWTILVLQEAVIAYFLLILNDMQIALFIQVVFFGIPITILVATIFSLDYRSLRRNASFLIAFAYWFQIVIGLVLLIVNGTPLDWIYFVANSVNSFVLFVGFVLLAHSKRQLEK